MSKSSEATKQAPAYDVDGETARLDMPDVVVEGRRLNRCTADVGITAPLETDETRHVRETWHERLLPSTLPDEAPVVTLGWPTHGPYVMAPHGIYLDTYLGVGQKVLDEHHPRFRKMLAELDAAGAMLRREIVTDDYVAADPERRVKTPADLGALWAGAVAERWPTADGYRCFFSSSGAEAVEAAEKLCFQHAYKRFLATHGAQTFARVMAELDIPAVSYFDGDPGLPGEVVYRDYPFHIVGCEGAFHGRTLGALSLTWSKKAHRLAYPNPVQFHHVPFNASDDPVRALIDPRGIVELLEIPGELRRVLYEQKRIPRDLFAGFVAEPFQGEGGYLPGDPAFFAAARAVCDETGGLLVVDEVQSVARTGRLFMTERLDVRPDVVCTAKSMVLGVTVASARLADELHIGWHSNTWGAGRVFDTNFAHATLDTLLNYREPAFGGLSYFENEDVKGDQLAAGLDRLVARHPHVLVGHRGHGLMRALLVRRRAEVEQVGWQRGVKLLGCGWAADVSPIRLLLLADTLGREVDALLAVLDATFGAIPA